MRLQAPVVTCPGPPFISMLFPVSSWKIHIQSILQIVEPALMTAYKDQLLMKQVSPYFNIL